MLPSQRCSISNHSPPLCSHCELLGIWGSPQPELRTCTPLQTPAQLQQRREQGLLQWNGSDGSHVLYGMLERDRLSLGSPQKLCPSPKVSPPSAPSLPDPWIMGTRAVWGTARSGMRTLSLNPETWPHQVWPHSGAPSPNPAPCLFLSGAETWGLRGGTHWGTSTLALWGQRWALGPPQGASAPLAHRWAQEGPCQRSGTKPRGRESGVRFSCWHQLCFSLPHRALQRGSLLLAWPPSAC